MNVITYWEGHQPPYIAECLATVRQHCRQDCRYLHVTPEQFERHGLDQVLHPRWRTIKQFGVKSDCVRVAMLARYGGLYVDADTVMLRSPVGIIDESLDCQYMTWTNPPRRVIAGYVYLRPGSPVAVKWLENVNRFLADGRTGWTDLGERCLTPAVDAHPGTTAEMPLSTFLPIEIDCDVPQFFKPGDFRSYTQDRTIAFGLNHSWMSRVHPVEMFASPQKQQESPLIIHKLLTSAREGLAKPPKITVCCVTYRRPELLGRMIAAFEAQDYPNREMLILDDSGELAEASGPNWRLISSPERSPTLGSKRNRLARMVSADTAAIVPWDDDDLVMPWALSAVAAGLQRGEWIRPSLALARSSEKFVPLKTWAIQDQSDKAYHPAWGYSVGAFWVAGGYPEDVSLGEDLVLARRLRDLHIAEADPMTLGFAPYYVFAPWSNTHFSYPHHDYQAWTGDGAGTVAARQHGLQLTRENIVGDPLPRPFRNNWWGDVTR